MINIVETDFKKIITLKNKQNEITIQIKKILNHVLLSEGRNISYAKNMKDLMGIASLNIFDDIDYELQVAEVDSLLERAYVAGGIICSGGTQPHLKSRN